MCIFMIHTVAMNCEWKTYGTRWCTVGIVECALDLEHMILSFNVDGKFQGIAYQLNANKSYHFVLTLGDENDSVKVLSEKQVYGHFYDTTKIQNLPDIDALYIKNEGFFLFVVGLAISQLLKCFTFALHF